MNVIDHLLIHYKHSCLTVIGYHTVQFHHNGREVRTIKMGKNYVLTCGDEITISDSNGIDRAIDFITKMAGRRE
nr:MAG TPA: hypothetical protein [Bacteriophage sp.]